MRPHTDFATYTPDVANVIPPQQAGLIAHRAGVADASGWCPVNGLSFESRLQSNIHVIGDAAIAAPMPKSAFAANAQAKVCAIALVRLFRGLSPESTVLANTCYSYLEPESAISISGALPDARRSIFFALPPPPVPALGSSGRSARPRGASCSGLVSRDNSGDLRLKTISQ